jgi:hypothetical protein
MRPRDDGRKERNEMATLVATGYPDELVAGTAS